jgi:hypothetical protein
VVTSSGNYSATFTNECGTGQTSNTITTTITGPFVPVVQIQNQCKLSAPAKGSNYQWYFNNIPIQGANTAFYTVPVTGFYHVSMTNQTGCSGTSLAVLAQPCISSTAEHLSDNRILLYPNPASSDITIEIQHNSDPVEIQMDLYASDGRFVSTVYQGYVGQVGDRVNCKLPPVPSGLYSYRIQSGAGYSCGHLMIIRQ